MYTAVDESKEKITREQNSGLPGMPKATPRSRYYKLKQCGGEPVLNWILRNRAELWFGAVLVMLGIARLIIPIRSEVGTIGFACGNPLAYLGGQDAFGVLSESAGICDGVLRTAIAEGASALGLGLLLASAGVVRWRRTRRIEYQTIRPPCEDVPEAQVTLAAARKIESVSQLLDHVAKSERRGRPPTVLGFLLSVFAMFTFSSLVIVALVLDRPSLNSYIPLVFAFDGVVACVLIGGVFLTISKDPARLLLSGIAGQNAVALQHASQLARPLDEEPEFFPPLEDDREATMPKTPLVLVQTIEVLPQARRAAATRARALVSGQPIRRAAKNPYLDLELVQEMLGRRRSVRSSPDTEAVLVEPREVSFGNQNGVRSTKTSTPRSAKAG